MDKKQKEAAMRAHWKMLDAAQEGVIVARWELERLKKESQRIEAEYQERKRKFLEESEG